MGMAVGIMFLLWSTNVFIKAVGLGNSSSSSSSERERERERDGNDGGNGVFNVAFGIG